MLVNVSRTQENYMFSRNRFSDLADSLRSGFFADKVILTLAKARKSGRLSEEERPVLDEVVAFFQRVLEGFEWSEQPNFTMHSAESAEAFSKATRVLPDVGSSEVFKDHVEKLLDDAGRIQQSLSVEKKRADRLINFFTAYGQEELERTDDLINPKDDLRTGSWTSMKVLSGL